jgi:hypothetical protein
MYDDWGSGSSDTLISTVRTSIREEGDGHALFSDTILRSCVKAKKRMRGQASIRNAVSFCVTVRTFRIILITYIFGMLFQAARNLTCCFPPFIIVWDTLAVEMVKIIKFISSVSGH